MDDVDSKDFDTQDFGSEDLDEMVVYGERSAISPDIKPVPFDDDTGSRGVSHSPLNLGGGGAAEVKMPTERAEAVGKKPTGKRISSAERITRVRTFFAKLHPGAIDFLDQQISNWLKDNPSVVIKRTDTTTGQIQAKKTEPNIIITVWY